MPNMKSKRVKKLYIVVRGRQPGLYFTWSGANGAEAQVKGVVGAVFKGFSEPAEAGRWLRSIQVDPAGLPPELIELLKTAEGDSNSQVESQEELSKGKVVIYTDGACVGNPGPGGFAAVLIFGKRRKEISGGFRLTTNNRMELIACIKALQVLKNPSQVVLYSDSRYVVDGMAKGWAEKWKTNGWQRNGSQNVENADLWEELLRESNRHTVEFRWVKGHASFPENARCDRLAVIASQGQRLVDDKGYDLKKRL
jgi:ribonuclease HI